MCKVYVSNWAVQKFCVTYFLNDPKVCIMRGIMSHSSREMSSLYFISPLYVPLTNVKIKFHISVFRVSLQRDTRFQFYRHKVMHSQNLDFFINIVFMFGFLKLSQSP